MNKFDKYLEFPCILHISIGTVNRDLLVLRQQAKTNIKRYIDERLPEEYEKCLIGINSILKEAWNIFQTTEDNSSSSLPPSSLLQSQQHQQHQQQQSLDANLTTDHKSNSKPNTSSLSP